jgi:ankyrin repeat protein
MEILEAAKAGKVCQVDRLLYSISLPEVEKRYQLTALEVAAQHGQVGVMRLLIRRIADPNGVAGHHEGVALHLAGKHGQEAVVDILCNSGADLDSTALEKRTPLIWASSEGHVGVVQRLLHHMKCKGMDAKDHFDMLRALHFAAANGHDEVVKLLLQHGADATITDVLDMTPLSWACQGGHLGVAQLLLEHQGLQALGMTPITGATPLHYAARVGREDVVKFLLGKGAHANSQRADGWTPFMEASSKGHVGVARMLLEHMGGQDVDTLNSCGQTALHWAAGYGHEDMVAFLLSKGANASIQDEEGRTPFLDMAYNSGRVGVARLLFEHMGGQDVDARDLDSRTALFHAAGNGHDDLVALLLSKGANATIQNDEGLTPLMHASGNGCVGVARLLLEHMGGEGIDTRDDKGKTALHHAAFEGHDEVVSFLLAKGADPNTTDLDGFTALATACVEYQWPVVLLLATHMGERALETRDGEGRTPLYLACEQHDWGGARLLLLAGADHTTTDNQGDRPPGFDENILPVSTRTHLLSMILNAFRSPSCHARSSYKGSASPCCPPWRMCTHAPDWHPCPSCSGGRASWSAPTSCTDRGVFRMLPGGFLRPLVCLPSSRLAWRPRHLGWRLWA